MSDVLQLSDVCLMSPTRADKTGSKLCRPNDEQSHDLKRTMCGLAPTTREMGGAPRNPAS